MLLSNQKEQGYNYNDEFELNVDSIDFGQLGLNS
jgi:hypothetical protein